MQQQQKNTQHAIVCLKERESEWHPFLYKDDIAEADIMTGDDHAVWHT